MASQTTTLERALAVLAIISVTLARRRTLVIYQAVSAVHDKLVASPVTTPRQMSLRQSSLEPLLRRLERNGALFFDTFSARRLMAGRLHIAKHGTNTVGK